MEHVRLIAVLPEESNNSSDYIYNIISLTLYPASFMALSLQCETIKFQKVKSTRKIQTNCFDNVCIVLRADWPIPLLL